MKHWIHEWNEPQPGAELIDIVTGEAVAFQKTDVTVPTFPDWGEELAPFQKTELVSTATLPPEMCRLTSQRSEA